MPCSAAQRISPCSNGWRVLMVPATGSSTPKGSPKGPAGLCRTVGITRAYALITNRSPAARPELPGAALHLARLRAGLDEGSADAQLDHALAALAAGDAAEAGWAARRCRDASAPGQRRGLVERVATFGRDNPGLDTAALHRTIAG
jgi:hypothetical protein